jgi:hypothetical protein
LNPGVWRFALVLFLIVTSGYGFSFFLPQIVKRLSGASDLAVGLWTAVPFTVAAIGMISVAAHSDSHGRAAAARRGLCGSLAAPALPRARSADRQSSRSRSLAAAAVGLYSATPPFWSLPTAFLRGDGAAAGIGLINSVGNLGGFVGPYLMGWMQGFRDSASASESWPQARCFRACWSSSERGPENPRTCESANPRTCEPANL